jgi:hypothetical protein
LANIAPFFLSPSGLNAALDGENLLSEPLLDYRQTSTSFFDVNLPADNLFGVPPDLYPFTVSDGFWVAIEPLSTGTHFLDFGGTFNLPGRPSFSVQSLYLLTVDPLAVTVPEPSVVLLLVSGLLGIAYLSRRRESCDRC